MDLRELQFEATPSLLTPHNSVSWGRPEIDPNLLSLGSPVSPLQVGIWGLAVDGGCWAGDGDPIQTEQFIAT